VRAATPGLTLEVFNEARRHVPREIVERASVALRDARADAVVTIGGGSATGLGKALRLAADFFFVAVPTTYAGSELTDLYGITSQDGKKTGRDARVLPDVVLYDVELTLSMPLGLSVTSLLNALAHPLGALSTGLLEGDAEERALEAASDVYRAATEIVRAPRDLGARSAALRATVGAGHVLRHSKVGVHHQLAHALGGRFDLDHAGLHSVLLPHTLRLFAERSPALYERVESRLANDLPRRLTELLARAGAPGSLAALGLPRDALSAFLDERPDLPRAPLEAALDGEV
jgi:maleylacetate reductase